jgi:hypothetical protein
MAGCAGYTSMGDGGAARAASAGTAAGEGAQAKPNLSWGASAMSGRRDRQLVLQGVVPNGEREERGGAGVGGEGQG